MLKKSTMCTRTMGLPGQYKIFYRHRRKISIVKKDSTALKEMWQFLLYYTWKNWSAELSKNPNSFILTAVFRTCEIFVQNRIPDPNLWIMDPGLDPAPDPDPALFFSVFQDANKYAKFFFAFYLLYVHLHQSSNFEDNRWSRSHKKL